MAGYKYYLKGCVQCIGGYRMYTDHEARQNISRNLYLFMLSHDRVEWRKDQMFILQLNGM
jgi:hypothetical protein